MDQLIAQIAQAMAGQGAGQYDPELMAQAGGAANLPMDTASQERYASEQMRKQAMVDSLLAQFGDMPVGQVDPYGAAPNVVGPSEYTQSGAPVERPRMAPTPTPPQEPGAGPRTIMHNGQPVTLQPMQYEDDPNGYWDARVMGNGKGRSFYAINDEVFYLD